MASHLLSTLLTPFRGGFTRPTWHKVLILLEGTLLTRGHRTVTAALRTMGLHQLAQFNIFHHVLSRARSTQGYPKMSRGLRWLCLMLVVKPPWTQRAFALPFLCVLLSSAELDAKEGRRHKTVPDWTGQLIKVVRRWLPDRPMTLVGDGAYSSTELGLTCRACQVTLIAPLRADACLYAPLPPRPPRQEGRPRVVGERLPRLDHILADPTTHWQKTTVTGAYTLWQARKANRDTNKTQGENQQANVGRLVLSGFALSIDNLVVGFALSFYHVPFLLAAGVIAVVSVAMSLIGLELGNQFGKRFEQWSEMLSGVILILVGLAIGFGLF